MGIVRTNVNDIERNFAKFDLALICEDKYKSLKHIDMVVYTMLKNQESLSIASVRGGNKRYVDKNGNIFISVSQEKLSKILNTTRPTLKASLDRLSKCDLIEVLIMGNMKCNRIYVGKAESTITLGEYINKIGTELDEDVEEFTPSIEVATIDSINKKADTGKVSTGQKSKINNSNTIIHKNNKNNTKKTKFHNLENESIHNYSKDELEKMLQESQKGKFDCDKNINSEVEVEEEVDQERKFVPNFNW